MRAHGYPALLAIMVSAACSAYIDDFEVDEGAAGAPAPGPDAHESPSIGLITCGIDAAPPAGAPLPFCDIEAGRFLMGCQADEETCADDELPQHEVGISAFRIQRFEVTVEAFREFTQAAPAWAPGGESASLHCDGAYLKAWTDGKPPGGSLKRPVTGVCWHAADAFCRWLGQGYRLPTEAEWERVARGAEDGTDGGAYRIYPFDDLSCANANYSDCSGAPADVGTREGVSFGRIYDMGGNAWEWVADWYDDAYYCDPSSEGGYGLPDCNSSFEWQDPTGPASGIHRVVRGGSWFQDAAWMRNAKREHLPPDFASNIAGFRCAGDL